MTDEQMEERARMQSYGMRAMTATEIGAAQEKAFIRKHKCKEGFLGSKD